MCTVVCKLKIITVINKNFVQFLSLSKMTKDDILLVQLDWEIIDKYSCIYLKGTVWHFIDIYIVEWLPVEPSEANWTGHNLL